MLYGLYLSAAGASVQDARVDSIANNLANVNTPGFHRMVQTFSERQPESAEDPGSAFESDQLLDRIGGGVFLARTQIDRSSGPLQRTGRQLDVAIRGNGYFAVQAGKETLFTRAGNFVVDDGGTLRTGSGYALLDPRGQTITLEKPETEGFIDRLDLRSFPADAPLRKAGANLLRFEGDGTRLDPKGKVIRGFLERSGVNAVKELIGMIQAQRTFEANGRLIDLQTETLTQAVRDIPRLT